MPKEIITREMLEIATNIATGKGHYVLASMVYHNKPRLEKHKILTPSASTLCGLVQYKQAAKILRVITPATMNCVRCKQAFAKHEEARLVGQKLKLVKMLKTSDGKTFPLNAKTAALKHENKLTATKKEKGFVTTAKRVLFADGDMFDKDMMEVFEQDVGDAIESNFEFGETHEIGLESVQTEEFLGFLHEMLVKHGAKIRSMVIIYQGIYGTLVPCRNTMENMQRNGNDIYI